MWRLWVTGKILHTGFWWGEVMERGHLEYLDIDGRVMLKWIFKNLDGETWTVLLWLRVGAGGSRLWLW